MPDAQYLPTLDPHQSPSVALLVRSLVEDGVDKALKRALVEYRNSTLTEQTAYAYIAQIAALRGLTAALEDRIKHYKE
jgi:hypothetical protein